ncbi:MAG: stage II sporulation protein R [Lachnospiraceae bacterium]|nr:stage II sporulation protein R [Lachnospiraceae bacterium]
MSKKHKLMIAGAAFVVVVTGVLMHLYGEAVKGQKRQRAIADEIIRLHVVANSDSPKDQELKLQVKETIVTYLRGEMKDAQTVGEARQAIRENLSEIEEIANEKMAKEGFDYRAKASLGVCYFPVKQYGDMTFPAGDYEALRVSLGEGEGKNWWCVMYPTLCFVDSTYQVVPDSSKEKLKETLTWEEYDSLLDGGEEVSYSFRFFEWLQNIA